MRLAIAQVPQGSLYPALYRTEALIAERVLSDVSQVNGLGDQVPYNCPRLWRRPVGNGHAW